MRITRLAIAGSLLGVFLVGSALDREAGASDLRQPLSVNQTAFEYDNYLYFAPEEQAGAAPSEQPAPVVERSPSDIPATAAGEAPASYYARAPSVTFGAWLEVGISGVASNPADGFNGVVTFNDRDGEFQMNQLWLYLDRVADTGGYGWAWGGHVDFVYGTDAFFTQAIDGLEASWNQTEPYYQVALPQFYLDVAYNDLTIRMGHFFTPVGYERVEAPENFFYSHSYAMQYGEPKTHTGLLGIYQVTNQLAVVVGFQRGLDQFDDTTGKDSLGFLGGVNWVSANERLELAFAVSASEETPVDTHVTVYSLVGVLHLTDYFRWVVQHDYGQAALPGVTTSEWYGLNQYFLYDINPYWAAGLRFEWFRDDDGAVVTGVRPPNALNGVFFPGNFYEIALGLNWTPRDNIIVRPEVRWDWSDARDPVLGRRPYDAGDRGDQFLFGIDLIVTY